jgi:hypothetical protein
VDVTLFVYYPLGGLSLSVSVCVYVPVGGRKEIRALSLRQTINKRIVQLYYCDVTPVLFTAPSHSVSSVCTSIFM